MGDLIKFVEAIPSSRSNLVPNPSFEVNTAGWAGGNATLARTTAQAFTGTASMSVTAASAATMSADQTGGTSGAPVRGKRPYTARVSFRPATTARVCLTRIDWFDASGVYISSSDSSTASDTTGLWTTISVTALAPATAAFARIRAIIASPANGEVHYIDGIMLENSVDALGAYADGSSVGWEWTGTAHQSASHTAAVVSLNLNDEVVFRCRSFSAPPPRLRRASSANAMRDGISVSSSQYDSRILTLELDLITATQDLSAAALQQLFRELDRETNVLKYQPTGASVPVYFRTYRSDMASLIDVTGPAAYRIPTIDLLAEPFAYGELDVASATVPNDPGAGGCAFDFGDVLGDVPAPVQIFDVTAVRSKGIVANWRRRDTTGTYDFSNAGFVQAETLTLGTDTTNPGGAADAVMSGAGTTNYVRTSFATTTAMATRASYATSLPASLHRVFAVVRRSDATSVMNARMTYSGPVTGFTGETVVIPQTTQRQILDLGVIDLRVPNGTADKTVPLTVNLQAQRVSGAGTLDWDLVYLLQADQHLAQWSTGVADDTSSDLYLNSERDSLQALLASGYTLPEPDSFGKTIPYSGSLPYAYPDTDGQFVWIVSTSTAHDKTLSSSLVLVMNPRYLYVRPSGS